MSDQACSQCGDRVYCLSSRFWCDGCEEEADLAQVPTTPVRPSVASQ